MRHQQLGPSDFGGQLQPPERMAVRFCSAAAVLLLVGLGLYLCVRPEHSLLAVPARFHAETPLLALPAFLAGSLPSFLHAFAFALLTAAAVDRPGALVPAALAWAAVNAVFEFGQHPALAHVWQACQDAYASPASDLLAGYFLRGTFDPFDLAAIAAAPLMALLMVRTRER